MTNNNTMVLQQATGNPSSPTQIGFTFTVPSNQPVSLEVELDGDTISLHITAPTNVERTWSNVTTHQNATKFGIGAQNNNRTLGDDFTFTPAG